VGCAVSTRARLHDPNEDRGAAVGSLEDLSRLVLGHRSGRTPWFARRKVDELDHVTADQVVNLGSADRRRRVLLIMTSVRLLRNGAIC
jgi:hypothetical protein